MSAPTTDRGGIQQTIRALIAAGYALDSVFDGEPYDPEPGIDEDGDQIVRTETAAVEAITAVDDAHLFVTKDGTRSWVRFVMGNEPEEVICDHGESLEPVLGPLMDRWADAA